jgi:uncharacterized protein YegL
VFISRPPALPLGSGTALGAALNLLMDEIDQNVRKNTPEVKGDFKPVIYLLTDGRPTDSVDAAIARWTSKYARNAEMVAIGFGGDVDLAVLKRITNQTFQFKQSKPEDFRKFIQWISASISMQSKRLDDGGDSPLAPQPEFLERAEGKPDTPPAPDSCVILTGRCSKNRNPYLIRFDLQPDNEFYVAGGSFQLNESYFEWSGPGPAADLKVSMAQLDGAPPCPWCANQYSLARCGCGKLFCCPSVGVVECPWCRKQVKVVAADDYEVGRGRG